VISIFARPTIFLIQTRYGRLQGSFRRESDREAQYCIAFRGLPGSVKDAKQTGASSSQNRPNSASNVFPGALVPGISPGDLFFHMTITGLVLSPFALWMTDFSTPINKGLEGLTDSASP
jgi:hypothetical protein